MSVVNQSVVFYFLLLLSHWSFGATLASQNHNGIENSQNTIEGTLSSQNVSENSDAREEVSPNTCNLYSEADFSDKSFMFELKDSTTLDEEYLKANDWNITKSLYVSNGCLLTLCNKILTDGNSSEDHCKLFEEGPYPEIDEKWHQLTNAQCNCKFDHLNYIILAQMEKAIEKQTEMIKEIKEKVNYKTG